VGILKKKFILDNKESVTAGGEEITGIWSKPFSRKVLSDKI